MRAAEITGQGVVEVVDRAVPKATGDLIVVKVLVAPMCTEFKKRRDGEEDRALGHEAVGVVVDAGDSRRVAVGDRVAVMPHYGCGRCYLCTSGDYMHCPNQRDVLAETGQEYGAATYAQYLLKPDWLVVKIPDDISLVHGAMACCGFGPTFGALERMGVDALDVLVVSGCGPVGLGAIVQGVTRGARVLAIETHPYRAELARKLGAERVLNPMEEDVPALVRELTGRGADAGIETSGAPNAAKALALSIRSRGKLSVVAWAGDVTFPPLVKQGLDIFGVWHWNSLTHAEEMWRTVRKAGPLIDTMVTHALPLEDVSEAMDIQDAGVCGKIILLPHGELDGSPLQPV
ncbi:zinc-binding dehydrogenase [Naasia sp. SYSU D00948]|uniref:zinc-dependent alcohol dehydrogenase n=1 Tax=Naasia sp. SYSU D00948 TaxID=2817379 RepID=UPI001B307330|nr:zinc-binding dehydrogenase [Naasia sp. SYSU D00948]